MDDNWVVSPWLRKPPWSSLCQAAQQLNGCLLGKMQNSTLRGLWGCWGGNQWWQGLNQLPQPLLPEGSTQMNFGRFFAPFRAEDIEMIKHDPKGLRCKKYPYKSNPVDTLPSRTSARDATMVSTKKWASCTSVSDFADSWHASPLRISLSTAIRWDGLCNYTASALW